MWPWRRRERFSLEELRYLTEQLQKTSFVNDYNKDSVIETLRSIAELMIWGDQHDPTFFEQFMEDQVMLLFLHILKLSTYTTSVAVQLLQSISIMIQNTHNEHAIYYIFSNGYLNDFIVYPFDFQHEELLAYYISLLRTISTKLDRTTISFFIKIDHDEVVSFPLYTEGVKFFRHEESMVRIAVRALTLNVFHVDDKSVRKFITSDKAVGYIRNLVEYLNEKTHGIEELLTDIERIHDSDQTNRVEAGIAETEEILDYCNDIIHAGIPELARAMTDNLLQNYVFPLLRSLGSTNSLPVLHSLTRILYLVKHKPLANGIAAALLCESTTSTKPKTNFDITSTTNLTNTQQHHLPENGLSTSSCPRKVILSCIVSMNQKLALTAVCFLLALLHSEVDDSLMDLIGLLPRLKQHKRRLLQALMGSNTDEEALFSSFSIKTESNGDVCAALLAETGDKVNTIAPSHHDDDDDSSKTTNNNNNKEYCCSDVYNSEVVEKLLELLCRRPPPCFDALFHSGALLWQILPDQLGAVRTQRLEAVRKACVEAKEDLLKEVEECWCDVIPSLLSNEWKSCKEAFGNLNRKEASFFLPALTQTSVQFQENDSSSSIAAERMQATVKTFTVLQQIEQLLSEGRVREISCGNLNSPLPPVKVGSEIDLSNAIACRIAFERGKERGVYLLAVTRGVSGWLLLADVSSNSKDGCGIIRVLAPLSGSMPEIDEEHPRWLHLRIRPPGMDYCSSKKKKKKWSGGGSGGGGGGGGKRVDGRWTVAFSDVEECKKAKECVMKELFCQKNSVIQLLQPFFSTTREEVIN